jgi:hypothetical protein
VRLGLTVVYAECPQDVVDLFTDLGPCLITDQDIHGPKFSYFIHNAPVHAFVTFAARIHGSVVGLATDKELCVCASVDYRGVTDWTMCRVHGHWFNPLLYVEGRVRCLESILQPECLPSDDSSQSSGGFEGLFNSLLGQPTKEFLILGDVLLLLFGEGR